MRVSPAVVLQLHRSGLSDQQIADQTGADLSDVSATISTRKALVAGGITVESYEAPPSLDAVALLAWASAHPTAAVRRDAERALTALEALGVRHKSEAELEAVSSTVVKLQERLERLKAREAELKKGGKGGKAAKGSRPPVVRDYTPSEVRAWARKAGVHCPPVGVIPAPVVAAWRIATAPAPQ
ncbi:hypothetical protein [Streptomyces goshikiensis]